MLLRSLSTLRAESISSLLPGEPFMWESQLERAQRNNRWRSMLSAHTLCVLKDYSMADGKESVRRKAPSVKSWEEATLGLDTDVWLRGYRKSLKPYKTAGDALSFYTRIFDHAPVAILILAPE